MKGWQKVYHINGNEKKAMVAVLISEKLTLKQVLYLETKRGIAYWYRGQFIRKKQHL